MRKCTRKDVNKRQIISRNLAVSGVHIYLPYKQGVPRNMEIITRLRFNRHSFSNLIMLGTYSEQKTLHVFLKLWDFIKVVCYLSFKIQRR